jgi:hypothetical protein
LRIGLKDQFSYHRKHIKTGAKKSNLLGALRTLKLDKRFQFIYEHVDSHQGCYKLWHFLTPEDQLIAKCKVSANSAVAWSVRGPCLPNRGNQLLPLEIEKSAVFMDGMKPTLDVAEAVWFCPGEVGARTFCTAPKGKAGFGMG